MMIQCNGTKIQTATFIKWGGSSSQTARHLTFTYLPMEKSCRIGDKITLYDNDNQLIFKGMVYDTDYDTERKNYTVNCFDLLYNMLKSDAYGRFTGTAAQIAQHICAVFGLNSKITLARTSQQIITTGDLTYYDVMKKAVIKDLQNSKYYSIHILDNDVYLSLPDSKKSVAELSSTTNIRSAGYSENIYNMINKIAVVDDLSNVLSSSVNNEDIARYGLFQKVKTEQYTEDDVLIVPKLHGADYGARLTISGNIKCITGKNVNILEPHTGFNGSFFIINDEHTWDAGDYVTDLGVIFNG